MIALKEIGNESLAKIAGLKEKLNLFREMNLDKEAGEIQHQISEIEAAAILYPIVDKTMGRNMLCPTIEMVCGGSERYWGGPARLDYTYQRDGKMPWYSCQVGKHKPQWLSHSHKYQLALGVWRIRDYSQYMPFMFMNEPAAPRPEVPLCCAALMKEAKEIGLEDFEVWAPPHFGQEKMIDPWLVGHKHGLKFKVADWR